jgi:hypothetical protein
MLLLFNLFCFPLLRWGCLPGLNLYFAMSQFDQPHITQKTETWPSSPKILGWIFTVWLHIINSFGKKSEILSSCVNFRKKPQKREEKICQRFWNHKNWKKTSKQKKNHWFWHYHSNTYFHFLSLDNETVENQYQLTRQMDEMMLQDVVYYM